MVRLGMPVLIELPGLHSNLALCGELGLSVLELSMNLPQYCPEALPAAAARKAQQASGIAFTLHLPEELDLATFHGSIREGCLQRAVEAVRWAGEACIGLVNMHLHGGVYYTLPDSRVFVYERYCEQFRTNLLRSMEVLSAEAAHAGVTLAVENTGQFHLDYIADPLQQLLDGGLVDLTWDTGHDGAAGLADNPFILKNLRHLRHMHLHDYTGESCHKPLFTGELDVTEALSLAEAAGAVAIVEVKTAGALRESVAAIKRRCGGL